MNTGEDEPSSGLNGRLRPRKSNAPSPQNKAIRKIEGKPAQDKPKRTSTPSKATPANPNDLSNKSDSLPTPQILCPYCDRKFATKQAVSKHARHIHLSSSKQDSFIGCLFCNHTEADANDVIRHMVDSHPNQYFACLNCHTRFFSTSELAEHKLNVCEKQKPYLSKLHQQATSGSKKNQKKLNVDRKDDFCDEKEYPEGHGFNGIVISCELKPSQVDDGDDIEDNITTNLILPPSKNLGNNSVIEKNAVIVLDDIQWNKRMPPNFSFHNTDADQILSRLGVVHRSPRTGESTRRDWLKSNDDSTQKFEKCFDTSFYSKVASNVQENLAKFLDGSFNFNPDPDNTIKTRKSKNSVVINTAEGFPILLAYEQYSRNVFDGYMPRGIAPKHKWKWDSIEIDKSFISPDQIKRDSHANNCIISLVSSLDISTQLCMRRKFDDTFLNSRTERKSEKQNTIGKELKEILESREIPPTSSQVVKHSSKVPSSRDGLEFPSHLGLVPSKPHFEVPPAVLSGEWVRPRCYVCCACGAQTRDSRALSLHMSTQHSNAQVQHYEIVGEALLNANISKYLYVPPNQVYNRTRPLRGFRDCTKCKKSITLEDLHQHMLDCAGDTPAVRRKCRYRPFGVRRRRPRLPDNTIRKNIRKGIRNRHRQKNHMRPRPRNRSEVGDAETIRKMIADLPAKRHRVLVNPLLRSGRKHDKQRNKLMMKHRPSEDPKIRKIRTIKEPSTSRNNDHITKDVDDDTNNDDDDKPLKPRMRRDASKSARQNDSIKRKAVLNRAKRKIKMKCPNVGNPQDSENAGNGAGNNQNQGLADNNNPRGIDINGGQYNARQHAGRGGYNNRQVQPGGDRQNGNANMNLAPAPNAPLKHSIASLTANSETHDKSVQFHRLFLMQQECNLLTQHGPSGQQRMFENEATASKLDKPPLATKPKPKETVVTNKEKNKSNKPRKGLNDCIAMLKNKLVDPIPPATVTNTNQISVQCGNDEPLDPDPRFFVQEPTIDRKIDPKPAEIFSRSVIPHDRPVEKNYTSDMPSTVTFEQISPKKASVPEKFSRPPKDSGRGRQKKSPSEVKQKSPVKRKSSRLKSTARVEAEIQQKLFDLPPQIEIIPQRPAPRSSSSSARTRRDSYTKNVNPELTINKKNLNEPQKVNDSLYMKPMGIFPESKLPQKSDLHQHHGILMSAEHIQASQQRMLALEHNKQNAISDQHQLIERRPYAEHRTLSEHRQLMDHMSASEQIHEYKSLRDHRLVSGERTRSEQRASMKEHKLAKHRVGTKQNLLSGHMSPPEKRPYSERRMHHVQRRPSEHRVHAEQRALNERRPTPELRLYPEQKSQYEQRMYAEQTRFEQLQYTNQLSFIDPSSLTEQERIHLEQRCLIEQRQRAEQVSAMEHRQYMDQFPEHGHTPDDQRSYINMRSYDEQRILMDPRAFAESRSYNDQRLLLEQLPIIEQVSLRDQRPLIAQKQLSEHKNKKDPRNDHKAHERSERTSLLEQRPISQHVSLKEQRSLKEYRTLKEKRSSTESRSSSEYMPINDQRYLMEQPLPEQRFTFEQNSSKGARTFNEEQSINENRLSEHRVLSKQTPSSEKYQLIEMNTLMENVPVAQNASSPEHETYVEQNLLSETYTDNHYNRQIQPDLYSENTIAQTEAIDIQPEPEEELADKVTKEINDYSGMSSEVPSARDSINLESGILSTPLDLSGKVLPPQCSEDLSKNDNALLTNNYDTYETLDLSNKGLDRQRFEKDPEISDIVVDLRVKTTQNTYQGNTMDFSTKVSDNDEDNVTDLSYRPCEEDYIPTDLSLKGKLRNDSTVTAGDEQVYDIQDLSNHKVKTSDENLEDFSKPPTPPINVVPVEENIDQPTDLSGKKSFTLSEIPEIPEVPESKDAYICMSIDLTEDDEGSSGVVTKFENEVEDTEAKTNSPLKAPLDKVSETEISEEIDIPISNTHNVSDESSLMLQKAVYESTLKIPQHIIRVTSSATETTPSIFVEVTSQSPNPVISASTPSCGPFSSFTTPVQNTLFIDTSVNSQNAIPERLPFTISGPPLNMAANTIVHTLPVYTLPNPVMSTLINKHESTTPVYTLANACISVTKIESSAATLTNTLLSVAGSTIANTTSVYTLAGTTIGAPMNYGVVQHNISPVAQHPSTVLINASINSGETAQRIDKNKLEARETKTTDNPSTTTANITDQDPETQRKIALLPKELVEILGTMPADHRKQLLNVLPQYVSTSTAESSTQSETIVQSLNFTTSTVCSKPVSPAVISKQRASTSRDIPPEYQYIPSINCLSPNYHLRYQPSSHFPGCYDLDTKHSISYLLPPPPPPPPLPPPLPPLPPPVSPVIKTQPDDDDVKPEVFISKEEVPEVIDVEDNKQLIEAFIGSGIEDEDLKYKIIDLTEDDAVPICNTEDDSVPISIELMKLAEDLTKQTVIPPQDITTYTAIVKTNKQKVSDKTASLRAVRIKTQLERHKSVSSENQRYNTTPSDTETTTKTTTKTTIESEIQIFTKTIMTAHPKIVAVNPDEEVNDLIESNRLLAVQQAEVSSSLHENENVSAGCKLNPVNTTPTDLKARTNDSKEKSRRILIPTEDVIKKDTELIPYCDPSIKPIIVTSSIQGNSNINESASNNLQTDTIYADNENQARPNDSTSQESSNEVMLNQILNTNYDSTVNNKNTNEHNKVKTTDEHLTEEDSEDDVSLAVIVKQKQLDQQKSIRKEENLDTCVAQNILHSTNKNNKIDTKDVTSKNVTCKSNIDFLIDCKLPEDSAKHDVSVPLNIFKSDQPSKKKYRKRNLSETIISARVTKDLKYVDSVLEGSIDITGDPKTEKYLEMHADITTEGNELKPVVDIEKSDFNDNKNPSISATGEKPLRSKIDEDLKKTTQNKQEKSMKKRKSTCRASKLKNRSDSVVLNEKKHEIQNLSEDVAIESDVKPIITSEATSSEDHSEDFSSDKIKQTRPKNLRNEDSGDLSLTSDLQLCSEVEENLSTPLRRSRRGKSMFVDSADIENEAFDNTDSIFGHKTPLTKKQLIFSKLLLDEENNTGPQAHSTPEKDAVESSLPLNASTIIIDSSHTDNSETINHRDIKTKSLKRKKSPQNKRKFNKKKKSIDSFQSHDEETNTNNSSSVVNDLNTSKLSEFNVALIPLPEIHNECRNSQIKQIITDEVVELIPGDDDCMNKPIGMDNEIIEDSTKLSSSTEKRKMNSFRVEVDQSSKPKKSKLTMKDDEETKDKERAVDSNDIITKHKAKSSIISETRTACYMPAARKTRSKSVVVKSSTADVYDPYDIDLDDMIEKSDSFRRRNVTLDKKSSNNHTKKSTLQKQANFKTISKSDKSAAPRTGVSKSIKSPKVIESEISVSAGNSNNNASDSDDSSKSDVPLQKYVEEKEKKILEAEVMALDRLNDDDTDPDASDKQDDKEKKSRRTLAVFNNLEKSTAADETEEQLRSEQFMESFGFVSERKPHKLTKKKKKSRSAAKIKLPTLNEILADANKTIREQQLSQRGLSRDEALFLDCCELLKSHKNDVGTAETTTLRSGAAKYACVTETTVKEFDLLDKPTKGDGDVDSITAKNILESEEVRNLEKDLISELKEAANASTLKPRVPLQRSVSDVGMAEDIQMSYSDPTESYKPIESSIAVQESTSNKAKKPEVKDKMYPDIIETINAFEDKFDKIKRKCRSQAAAAKQVQIISEPTISYKRRKKTDKKKGKKASKKNRQSTQVLTKGALKGFDGIKVSIPTSDINMSVIAPAIENLAKKKKKSGSKKRRNRRDLVSSGKYNSEPRTKDSSSSQKKVDVYEFMDNEDAELFEFRPSTLMERFKSISNKETPSTSKFHSVVNEVENMSESLSDGDDFVYMSDDYVCSDNETENSLLSCDVSSKVGSEPKKTSSPLKRKDVVEKNTVMGKIFKHNAVRTEKKSTKSKDSVKPKANLDQLFDSLLEEEPSSSMLKNDISSIKKDETVSNKYEKPSKYDKYSRTPPSADDFRTPTKFCTPSPKDCESPVRDCEPSTSKKLEESDIDFGPSTSRKHDSTILKDHKAVSPKKHDTSSSKRNDAVSSNSSATGTAKRRDTSPAAKSDDISYKTRETKVKPSKEKSPSAKLDEGISTSYDYSAEAYDQSSKYDDMGVARQRARRKCTVGKQNVLAETWSSESEPDGGPPRPNSAESVVLGAGRRKKGKKRDGQQVGGRRANGRQLAFKKQDGETRLTSRNCSNSAGGIRPGGVLGGHSADAESKGDGFATPGPSAPAGHSVPGAAKPRPRASAYYWSSEGDEEQEHVQQHGWIVGDSHKKLVTMLAHAKGRKRNNDDKRPLIE